MHTDRGITTMNAVKAVQLFIVVWTFSAVCQAEEHFIVNCDDVTGSVGKEVTFTCRVSLQRAECCIKTYKFQYPDDSTICKEEPPVNPCEQRNSFTCRYTPTTAVTEQFRFFVLTKCGQEKTKLTVNITGGNMNKFGSETPGPDNSLGFNVSAIAATVGCFILLLLIVIMTVIRKKKPNFNKSCGFQKRVFLCIRHDEDNSDRPKDVNNDSIA